MQEYCVANCQNFMYYVPKHSQGRCFGWIPGKEEGHDCITIYAIRINSLDFNCGYHIHNLEIQKHKKISPPTKVRLTCDTKILI